MSSNAISVRNLRKLYGLKAAVDGVDLEVPRGSFFGFLGPNGAGKSTTIRMLTGLIPPDSGEIEILGFRMPEQEQAIKQRIGLVPDESLLFDRLTGAEFLEFVGRMYSLPRPVAIQRARDLLDNWEASRQKFVKVFPTEYKRALAEIHAKKEAQAATAKAAQATSAASTAKKSQAAVPAK